MKKQIGKRSTLDIHFVECLFNIELVSLVYFVQFNLCVYMPVTLQPSDVHPGISSLE